MIELMLPWPPSTNTYWRNIVVKGRPRTLISKQGREYRNAALASIAEQRQGEPLSERLAVSVLLNPPDRRKRDLDNFNKALLDALTHAAVWDDDEQIDRLTIIRGPVVKGGSCEVVIERVSE